MNRSAAASGVAACAVASWVAVALPAGCIPDLPSDATSTLPAPIHCGDGIIDLDLGEQCDPGPGAGDAGLGGCRADCTMLCDAGLEWPQNHHCYELAAESAVSLQAASGSADGLCQQGSAHVVTFASEAEFAAVRDFFDAGLFWVGLSPARNTSGATIYKPTAASLWEPGWSTTCAGCYAFTSDASAPLPVYPGAADAGATGCIVASSDSVQGWQQYPCSVVAMARRRLPTPRVICEREPVGKLSAPCEAGTCFDLVATRGLKHYVYQEQQASAVDAQRACEGLGGRLVVLGSAEEREQLWLELSRQALQPDGVWIGLSAEPSVVAGGRRRLPAPTWDWDDGQPSSAYPSEWGSLEPRPPSTVSVSGRAFLWQLSNEDNTLAHDDLAFSTLPYVCELSRASATTSAAPSGLDGEGE